MAAFQSRYGTSATIIGTYSGKLSDSGERLLLATDQGQTIADFTYADIAKAMSIVLERDVTYVAVSPDELRTQLTGAGLDDGLAGFLVGLDETIATGTFARVGDDLTRLIGRPSTGLVEGLTAE